MKRALTALAAVLSLTAAAQPHAPALVMQWIAAWNSHDVEKVIPLFTDDVTYEDVTFGSLNHGTDELRKFAAFFFGAVPDMKFELTGASIKERHGSIEWVFTGTDVGVYKTGRKFTVRGVSIIDLDGHGRISRNLDYYDAATIMRQVGVLPAGEKGQSGESGK